MKLKEKLKEVPQILKNMLNKFPLTIIIIFAYSIFCAVTQDTEWIKPEIYEKIMLFGLYLASGCLLVESILEKINIKKIASYIAILIIASLLTKYGDTYWKIAISYVLTLYILTIYVLFKKSGKDFNEYLLKVFINTLKLNVIYGVLAIGIGIVSSIFVYLIWEEIGYSLVTSLEILLLGFYYFPKLIYCLVDTKEDVNKFFKGIIKYVLTSLVIISFIIIYMYIIKILSLREMPKNQIFRILSALFIIGMPIWTMMQFFKDESIWYKISTKLPLAFIPFIFLQIYTIGIRIYNNGITPLRYICIALILFEIIYIIVYCIKKEKIEILLLFLNAIIIVSIAVPGINMYKISDISQAKNLKIFKEKTEYTQKEKEKIYGAYKYLENSENGEKYIKELLNEEEIKTVKTLKPSRKNKIILDRIYIQGHSNNKKIEVKGYSYCTNVNSNSKADGKNIEETFKNVEFKKDNSEDNFIIADFTEIIKKYIEIYNNSGETELNNYIENNNNVQINENTKFIIKSFYLNYNKDSQIVENYSIKGYLLEK